MEQDPEGHVALMFLDISRARPRAVMKMELRAVVPAERFKHAAGRIGRLVYRPEVVAAGVPSFSRGAVPPRDCDRRVNA
eukprot:694565-Pyramimonas_sp.AAC.1